MADVLIVDGIIKDRFGNEYGIVKDDRYQMFNSVQDERIIYNQKEIDSLDLKSDGIARIILKDGTIHEHPRRVVIDPKINPYERCDLSRKDLDETIRVFCHRWPDWKELLYLDIINDRIQINERIIGGTDKFRPYMGNGSDLTEIIVELCRQTETITENGKTKTVRFDPKKETVIDAIQTLAFRNTRNSFVDTIRKVEWDGIPRIDTFLYDVGCRADIEQRAEQLYLRFVSRAIFLIALDRTINRSFRSIPFMLILIGEQGTGKSDICRWLGMDWYRSTMKSLDDEQKFIESVVGGVVVELAEGTQFSRKGSVEQLKALIEKEQIQYRKPYDRETTASPITFLSITTTNNPRILTDGSGNRRFYPVFKYRGKSENDKEIEDYSRADILQLWAEALQLYDDGFRWDDELLDPVLNVIFSKMQSSVLDIDPPFEDMKDYLDSYYGSKGSKVSNDDLREWLKAHDYYGKDAENKLQEFAKRYALGFGYRKIGPTTINGQLNKRGFEKI